MTAAMSDIYDPQFVKAVFDRCSDRYITFSLVCSFGFTERWRRQRVAAMPAPAAGGAWSLSSGAHSSDLLAPRNDGRVLSSRPSAGLRA
jgi:hypothetical protein